MSFTLQRRGELRAPNADPDLQRELDKFIPYEFIIRWFQNHEGRTGIENRFLVIQSGTASGKSTTIPSEMFGSLVQHRYANGGGLICTQPRVLTAIDNVKKIVSIPKYGAFLRIGETIGWSTQFSKLRPRRIGFLSATAGILAMQLQIFTDAEIASMYRYILIDEAHERPLSSDFMLSALKGFLQRNAHSAQCPFVVLMSATIDPPKFARYFLSRPDGDVNSLIDNIIICNALPSFARKMMWAPKTVTNIIAESARIIEGILDEYPAPRESWEYTTVASAEREKDDILIFLPGIAEIKEMHSALTKMNVARHKAGKTKVMIVVLNSQTVSENTQEYRQLDVPLRNIALTEENVERRVIVSTSVAETGKTFDTLRYVIDAGYSREPEYNPNIKVQLLLSKPAPIPRITQRWGRVGRKFDGVVHTLYTKEIYDKLPQSQLPEIITSNLSPIILQIVFEQQKIKHARAAKPYFRASDIDMLDPPQPDVLLDGLGRAHALGFIAHGPTEFTSDLEEFLASAKRAPITEVGITKLGRLALELTASITTTEVMEAIRMILAGFAWGYKPADLIAIATSKSLVMQRDDDEVKPSESARLKSKVSEIRMHIAYAEVFPSQDGITSMNAWHTALGDTFFDGLIMSTAIDRIFMRAQDNVAGIREWCANVGLNFESLLKFIEMRDGVCSALLALGMDIYRGVSILDYMRADCGPSLASAILKYKRCIFDGYRLNIVRWNAADKCYRTFTGLRVKSGIIEKNFGTEPGNEAQTIIFDAFSGKNNAKTATYDIVATQMSVLDGFIGEDPLFTQ